MSSCGAFHALIVVSTYASVTIRALIVVSTYKTRMQETWRPPPRLPRRSDLCFLQTEDGELYAWGCGPDEGDHQWITPTLVDPGAFQGAKVAMTAGGAAFSAAVMDNGAIYTFGAQGPWYNF